jgi:hypothetical protein
MTPSMIIPMTCFPWQGPTQMSWICTCSLPCLTALVPTCKGSRTKSCLWKGFGRQSKACGVTQSLLRLPGHVALYPNPHPQPTSSINNYSLDLYLSPNARSFVLAYRIVKLIITEQGNNAWLAHGTPRLNVRSDFVDTETGIKQKQAFEACNM